MLRKPAVAGKFYSSCSDELKNEINASYSHSIGVRDNKPVVNGKLKGIISPHAGYMFSGPPASWGFKRLSLEESLPERIIFLGPKHTPWGAPVAVSAANAWETPLGQINVDMDFSRELCNFSDIFTLDNDAHRAEHSIEVQLPFLQEIYCGSQFEMVAIAIHFDSFDKIIRIADSLRDFVEKHDAKETLLVVSSDFSHDTPIDEAYKIDAEAIALIKAFKSKEFYETVVFENRSICGLMPISVLLEYFKNSKLTSTLLKYSTSMDIMEHPRGVGYASIVFEDAR